MKDHVTINDNRNVFLDAINIATHALKPIVYKPIVCRKNFNNPGGQCYSWLNIDCWWFLWQQCMFTLIGRIADHSHKSLISREFQWNSRLAWWQAQTSKLTADRPRRVYFLFTCTRRRNPAHRRRPSGMHFPNRNHSDQIGDWMFTLVVKIPNYWGQEKSPILKNLTTSENAFYSDCDAFPSLLCDRVRRTINRVGSNQSQ